MARQKPPEDEEPVSDPVEEAVTEEVTAPVAPDPWAVLDKIGTALIAINEKLTAQPTGGNSEQLMVIQAQLAEAMNRVADATKTGAELQASETRRAHRPSNEVVPQISVFNRRGTKLPDDAEGPRKQPLKCLMLLPWLAEWESLTREEVDLLNLLQPGDYQVKRIDNSKVRMDVRIDYKVDKVTPSRLIIRHDTAFNNDNFKLIPPLPSVLRQMLKQHEKPYPQLANAVLTDEEEEALIELGELSVSQ